MHPTVLVTGATGATGRHVVAGLRERGASVRALVRTPELAGFPPDVETVAGDLLAPESLATAAKGVDAVFLLWPGFSPEGAREAVAALTEHAGRVVYLSAMNVRDDQRDNGVWGTVEQLVERSGVRWTFLRAGGFARNTLEWADQIRAGDVVRVPHPDAGRSLIHERDIAAVAVRALLDDGHDGAKYVLTGPETLTQREQVRLIGEAVGRTLRVEEQTPDEVRAQLQWGDTAYVDAALAYWAALVDNPEPVTTTVAEVTGAPAHTFRAWAADHADDFRVLSTAEVADRYATAFRTGRVGAALALLAPDVVRVAPLEHDAPLTGVADIMANSAQLGDGVEIQSVEVGAPLLAGDRFAVRFGFTEKQLAAGELTTTTKLCLYTVAAGRITREEVFYLERGRRRPR